jgi:PIF1-like helicase
LRLWEIVINCNRTPPEIKQNGVAWKRVVAEKHAEVIDVCSRNMPATSNAFSMACVVNSQFIPNEVHIVDKSYLSHAYESREWCHTIEEIETSFKLNTEQGCAFHIVVNHSCGPEFGQLKMYISGMAGTGKSQVLHAISEFFSQRNELYCLLILAPTRSAAALLGGSTYHSVLSISSDGNWSSNV